MGKIDPWKFVQKDKDLNELKPSLSGIYHKNGYIYATDAHILVKYKSDYPKQYEGKIIGKDGKVVKTKEGVAVTKYVNAESVIPDVKKCYEFEVDIQELENALKDVKKGRYNQKKLVIFPDWINEKNLKASISPTFTSPKGSQSTAGLGTYDAYLFKSAILPFMKATGINRIYMDKERSDARGAMLTNGRDVALIMPKYNPYPEEALSDPDAIVVRTKDLDAIPKYRRTEKESKPTEKKEMKKTTKKPTVMRKSMKKSACSTVKKSGNTIKMASKILKSQKEDYQKIFRTEVKKSKDPKTGAKKAGRIYRDRYGATAEARWKKALKRAK